MMIDAHCHITAEEFDLDRDQILAEAVKVGVKAIIAVCEFPGDFQNVLDLSKRYPDLIFPCIGVHPVQVGSRSVTIEECNEAEVWIRKHSEVLAGIGEVGLDFTPYHIKSPEDKEVQREVFRRQMRLSKELNLPLNVHSRSAGRPVIETLVEEGAENVVLHAFDGKPSVALKGVDAGYFFSVPPSIIRSEQKQRLVKQIPLSNLLLETDAPALGPEKQERNEPKNIEISCKEISRIKNIPVSQIITETTRNALRLFTKLPR
eukprot:Seg1731.11 transcript_id=Seg1731.11/GoldUCD/mRNA.D3Y31 product="putative deoxyribonuclease TATDN3" protein_id=Seg1731.11/GoldUCD/D3Y31